MEDKLFIKIKYKLGYKGSTYLYAVKEPNSRYNHSVYQDYKVYTMGKLVVMLHMSNKIYLQT